MFSFWNANDRLASEASSSFSQFPTGNAIQSRTAFSPFNPCPSEYTHGSAPKTVSSHTPPPPPLGISNLLNNHFFLSYFLFFYNARLSCFSSGGHWVGAAVTCGVTALSSVSSIGRKTTPKDGFAEIRISRIFLLKRTFQPAVTFCRLCLTYPYVTP